MDKPRIGLEALLSRLEEYFVARIVVQENATTEGQAAAGKAVQDSDLAWWFHDHGVILDCDRRDG